MSFKSQLSVLMAQEGVSVGELAKKIGVGTSTISKYRNNPQKLDVTTGKEWDRLCSYFGCQLGDLIEHCED